jgi:molybdenum cofactor guanylyltransferase
MDHSSPRILGAIIAGGRSRRFGGDKGAALVRGRALLDHVVEGMMPQCDDLIICGRFWRDVECVEDWPLPDMGPLGGLNAALHMAMVQGYDYVLSTGCDVLPVVDGVLLLGNGPQGGARYTDGHYISGLWPAILSASLDGYLRTTDNYSMQRWITFCSARAVTDPRPIYNLNTPHDMVVYANANQGISH